MLASVEGRSVQPELLTLRDLTQGLAGLPAHVGVRIVVEHLHEMLIRSSRLAERAQLYQTGPQVGLGDQRTTWEIPQMALDRQPEPLPNADAGPANRPVLLSALGSGNVWIAQSSVENSLGRRRRTGRRRPSRPPVHPLTGSPRQAAHHNTPRDERRLRDDPAHHAHPSPPKNPPMCAP